MLPPQRAERRGHSRTGRLATRKHDDSKCWSRCIGRKLVRRIVEQSTPKPVILDWSVCLDCQTQDFAQPLPNCLWLRQHRSNPSHQLGQEGGMRGQQPSRRTHRAYRAAGDRGVERRLMHSPNPEPRTDCPGRHEAYSLPRPLRQMQASAGRLSGCIQKIHMHQRGPWHPWRAGRNGAPASPRFGRHRRWRQAPGTKAELLQSGQAALPTCPAKAGTRVIWPIVGIRSRAGAVRCTAPNPAAAGASTLLTGADAPSQRHCA